MRFVAAAALLFAVACNDTGDSCDNKTIPVGNVCLPDALAPGIASVIDVQELCGNGCSSNPSCSAVYSNGLVVLDATQDICVSFQSAFCLNQPCMQRTMKCRLPALNPGRYTLTVPGGPSRSILVQACGASSCQFRLPDGGVQ